MSFPTNPLDVRLVFGFGANLGAAPTTWPFKDCTSDLRTTSDSSVAITVGRADRAKQGSPNSATFALNNFNSQYTVDHPAGANYPNVVENVPGIVATARNLNPTFEVDASDWGVSHGSVARSTVRAFSGVGSLLLTPLGGFATCFATNAAFIPVRDGGAVYVDAWVFSVAGWGSVNVSVDWFTSLGISTGTTDGPTVSVPAGVWTYVGAYLGPAPASTAQCLGKVVMSGTPAAGNTLWIDEARTSVPELCGFVDGWTPQFDDSGKLATVAVSMSSSRRRLGQGEPPVSSPMKRAVLTSAASLSLYQYWSCEDGSTSAQIGSALQGGPPMSLTFVGGLGPGMAALNPTTLDPAWLQAGLPPYGTLPLPQMSNGSGFQVSFPPGNASAWTVQFGVWIDPAEASTDTNIRVLAEWQTPGGTYVRWRMIADHSVATFGTYLVAYKADGTSSTVGATGQGFSRWDEIRVEAVQSGGNINVFWAVNGLTRSGTFTGTLAGVSGFIGNPDQYASARNFTVGHIRIWNQASVPDFQPGAPSPTNNLAAWYSHAGETAAARFTRTCGDDRLTASAVNNPGNSMAMGPQLAKATLDLLQDIEDADGGMLFEPFDAFGFAYIVRSDLYNLPVALTIDQAADQLAPPFAPVHDDALRQNYVTVTRQGGSSATFIGDTSRGTYKDTPTLNVAVDGVLYNIAAWRVNVNSQRSRLRFPSLNINPANPAAATLGPAFAATRGVGIRVQVVNTSPQMPPGVLDVLVSGYTKTVAYKAWKVGLLCSPYQPWVVGALDQNFKLEMAGQTLQSSLAPGATSLSLATAVGNQLFTTSAAFPADFPLDLNVGGWQIHVTAATGAASPQTLTITASPNTNTIPAGTPVTLWRPAVLAL